MKHDYFVYYIIKTGVDYAVAFLALIALSPLFLVVAIAIKLTSKGPVFFTQRRVGQYQKVFKIYKFRTMREEVAFDIHNPVIKGNNSNLTPIGRILRRTKIDELPQLFNILRGEMSFIGPRPFVEQYLDEYKSWELEKFMIKPGLTGWAQVHGNGWLELTNRSYYDIEYIQKLGPFIELLILLKSIMLVFTGEQRFIKPVSQADINKLRRNIYTTQMNFRFGREEYNMFNMFTRARQ